MTKTPRLSVPHDLLLEQQVASGFRWRHVGAKGVTSEMRRRHTRTMIRALRELRADMRAAAKRNEMRSVIRGVQGEFYPCKPDIFKETYEPVI